MWRSIFTGEYKYDQKMEIGIKLSEIRCKSYLVRRDIAYYGGCEYDEDEDACGRCHELLNILYKLFKILKFISRFATSVRDISELKPTECYSGIYNSIIDINNHRNIFSSLDDSIVDKVLPNLRAEQQAIRHVICLLMSR
jgi:hypothetical protein